MIFFLYNQPVRWMVVGADVNDDLLWEKNTAEWLADSGW
jgi:hypothetical protein